MRYVRLYALAVYRSWVAFLSGIGSIVLLFVGAVTPISAWLIELTAGVCVVVAMFTVWVNELLGREKADAALADEAGRKAAAERKRQVSLTIASLIRQGREIEAIPESHLHRDNVSDLWNVQQSWRNSAKVVFAAHCPHPTELAGMAGLGSGKWSVAQAEIRADIELLEAIQRAL
jgi:hypothetical protein